MVKFFCIIVQKQNDYTKILNSNDSATNLATKNSWLKTKDIEYVGYMHDLIWG